MSTTQDFKTTFKYNLTCIFLSLRAQLKKPLCPLTPCINDGDFYLTLPKIFEYPHMFIAFYFFFITYM